MFRDLHNERSKQTNVADLQFLLNYTLFSKIWGKKMLKKNLEYESILYKSFKIKLYYYQEKLSLRCNIILKLLPLF